jgi:glycogen(starch) synthase
MDRIEVIHNGVSATALLHEATCHELPSALQGRRYVVNVATFERKKGQDLLIRAFEQVVQRYEDLMLVLVGRRGAIQIELERMVAERGLTGKVVFLEDVPHGQAVVIIAGAELFVLSSRQEPFGIVLLEAGLFRTPIVATSAGGIPEVIVDGTTGSLVPPEDVDALATAMLRSIENAEMRTRQAEAMYERVTQHFTWSAAYRRYEALVKRQLDGPPASARGDREAARSTDIS